MSDHWEQSQKHATGQRLKKLSTEQLAAKVVKDYQQKQKEAIKKAEEEKIQKAIQEKEEKEKNTFLQKIQNHEEELKSQRKKINEVFESEMDVDPDPNYSKIVRKKRERFN